MNDYVTIMDIDFLNTTKEEFLQQVIVPRLTNEHKSFIVTANPEIVMEARENTDYKQSVKQADYVIPDGAGILLAAKFKEQPLQERIPGYELMLDLLAYANENRLRCYFLGAAETVNEKAVAEVQRRFPNLIIAGRHHGFVDMEDSSIAERVHQSDADLVFVAMGLPRQEKWIAQHINHLSKGVVMGVGGSFDVLAGTVKRAPAFWIRMNLEWLYRLLKQPVRFKRILKVLEFMIRIILRRG